MMPNERYPIIDKPEKNASRSRGALDILADLTGTIEGPEDWAVNFDRYLFETQAGYKMSFWVACDSPTRI